MESDSGWESEEFGDLYVEVSSYILTSFENDSTTLLGSCWVEAEPQHSRWWHVNLGPPQSLRLLVQKRELREMPVDTATPYQQLVDTIQKTLKVHQRSCVAEKQKFNKLPVCFLGSLVASNRLRHLHMEEAQESRAGTREHISII